MHIADLVPAHFGLNTEIRTFFEITTKDRHQNIDNNKQLKCKLKIKYTTERDASRIKFYVNLYCLVIKFSFKISIKIFINSTPDPLNAHY